MIAQAILRAVFVLATSVWVGGYVAIAVVARVATATLDPGDRVAFFRSLGRSYLWVGVPALVAALVTGGVLVRDHDWDALLSATVTAAVVLLVLLAVAIAQARKMTRLRRALLVTDADERLTTQVARGRWAAGALRALIGLITLTLVTLGAVLAT